MLSNCVTCQTPLRVDYPQRRPESADSEKKSEMVICEMLSGQSRNLMKLLTDASVPPDAPVCNDCSTALMKEMDEQAVYLDDEIKTYKAYMEHLKENHPAAQMAELRAYEQNVDDEIAALEKELKQLTAEEEKLDVELAQRRKAAEVSTEQSAELWATYRDNLRRVYEDQEEIAALDAERQYAEVQHRKLIDTSIMDMSFHIWVDANVGEINGFRLAYIKESLPVEYTEINAALGQCVLLLEILLERIGVQHHELVPVPMGSHSYIKLRRNGNDIETYPMYGQGTPLSGTSGVDAGIRRFLQLLEFLQKELKDRNKNFKPPYQIHADAIVDNGIKYNVTMTLNTESRWTRAMCLMLTNLKAAVAQCDALRSPIN